jgi:hypothetical protein
MVLHQIRILIRRFSFLMRIPVIATILIWCTFPALLAQHQDVAEKPSIWHISDGGATDSTSLLRALQAGKLNGHFRYFFMSTDNSAGLSDYHAHAAGGGLRYESSSFHGFRVGISGFYIFNVASSDLGKPDEASQALNRYETGLFDVENPGNDEEISRLEELLLKYSRGKTEIQVGKMLVNSPLINLQDGRMRPTGVEGVWFETSAIDRLRIEGGWIYSFSPRSTTRWFRGLIPSGCIRRAATRTVQGPHTEAICTAKELPSSASATDLCRASGFRRGTISRIRY